MYLLKSAIIRQDHKAISAKDLTMDFQIDYAKYENMTARQIFNSLESVKKRQQKLEKEKKQAEALFAFLQSKLNEKIKEPQSTPLKESKAYAVYKDNVSKMSAVQLEQLDKEIEADMNRDYGDEF